jgi:hypothetical protein
MDESQDGPGAMQARVQAAVLRMVADEAAVHPARILRTIPHADERDVARAVKVLLDDGYLVMDPRRATYLGDLDPIELTAKG